jgi:hypothetical protein
LNVLGQCCVVRAQGAKTYIEETSESARTFSAARHAFAATKFDSLVDQDSQLLETPAWAWYDKHTRAAYRHLYDP